MPEADRLRLKNRLTTDYTTPFGAYAPILAPDMVAAGEVGEDVLDAVDSTNVAVSAVSAAQSSTVSSANTARTALSSVPSSVASTGLRRLQVRPNDITSWTYTRINGAQAFGPTGLLEEFTTDSPVWAFDPVTRNPLGYEFGRASANTYTNPRMEGAVAGSPGTPPSNLTLTVGSGLSITCVGSFTVNGLPVVRYRIFGNASSAAVDNIIYAFNNIPTAAQNERWSVGAYIRFTDTPVGVNSARIRLRSQDAGGANIVDYPGSNFYTNLTFTPLKFAYTAPLTDVNTARARGFVDFGTIAGTVDATIDVGVIQFENTPFSGSFILPPIGTPGAFTRNNGAASVSVERLGSQYNYQACTIVTEWSSITGPFTASGTTFHACSASVGNLAGTDVMGMCVVPAHSQLLVRRFVNNIAQSEPVVSVSTIPAGQINKSAFSWDIPAGTIQIACNGVAGTLLTGQNTWPLITHLFPGSMPNRTLNGYLREIDILPVSIFGSALAALTV